MHQVPEPLAQLAQLRLDLLDGRLATLVAQLLAGLGARLARGLLGPGDLRLDVLAGVPPDVAIERGDCLVRGRRAALVEVGEHGRLAVADRARDVLEHGVGLVVVVGVAPASMPTAPPSSTPSGPPRMPINSPMVPPLSVARPSSSWPVASRRCSVPSWPRSTTAPSRRSIWSSAASSLRRARASYAWLSSLKVVTMTFSSMAPACVSARAPPDDTCVAAITAASCPPAVSTYGCHDAAPRPDRPPGRDLP